MKDLLALFDGLPRVRVGCPACGSHEGAIALIRHGFSFVRCASCSSLYVNPRPTDDALSEMYRRFPHFAAGHVDDISYNPVDEAREARYRLNCLLEVAGPGRLLDVGFGRGDFLRVARSLFDATGMDVAVRIAPDIRGVPAIRGHVGAVPFAGATLQVVTAFEVLEHLFEPKRFLSEVRRVLTLDGVFLVQTGDADSLLPRLNLEAWRYLLPPVHLNVFSRTALRMKLREAGFEQVRAWSFGRAPKRTPLVSRFPNPEAVRPILDFAARAGLIGQLCAFRKASPR